MTQVTLHALQQPVFNLTLIVTQYDESRAFYEHYCAPEYAGTVEHQSWLSLAAYDEAPVSKANLTRALNALLLRPSRHGGEQFFGFSII